MASFFKSIHEIGSSIPHDKTRTLIAGCFDLLHVGHLHLLEYAKSLEDVLIVCVLSDECVRSYKGPNRPIITEEYRAKMVSGLACTDYVYIGNQSPSDYETLSVLKPQSLVYGIEESQKDVVSSRVSRIAGQFPEIKIHYAERFIDSSISTSGIIKRVLSTA